MRIYSRSERKGMRVSLRWFAWEWNERRDWQLSMGLWLLVLAVMVAACLAAPAPAQAQQDPCLVCVEEHGWDECPCLPQAPEPPSSSTACIPPTHHISGCDDKIFLPQLGH